jgi:hypothetical protein
MFQGNMSTKENSSSIIKKALAESLISLEKQLMWAILWITRKMDMGKSFMMTGNR